jgi:large subunit ribosomal protein L25
MEQVSLRAETGRASGSRNARRLRRSGAVPAVVYGRGLTAVPVAVDRRDLYGALHTEAGLNAVINLDVDGSEYTTVAREIQRDPVRGEITHLDFIQISLTEAIEAEVGIEYLGEPVGVRDGGVVEQVQTSVYIEALPMAVPSSIELDISELEIGDSLSIGDLPRLEGVTYIDDPELTLVTVIVPSMVPTAEELEAEALEALEGEELAEGEEPAEGEEAEGEEAAEGEEEA